MILEAVLLCDPTITEVEVDPVEVTSNKVDHAGVTVDQGGMEVPPSTPTKAHSTAMLLADCMVAGPQAEAIDDTATGGATTEPSAEDMPTPREAAKRLARFIEEVQEMRLPPLINTPPKQKPAPKRTLPLRSRRIAVQQMDHILASKHGEVLLMKKMGFMAPSAPSFSVSKRSYDSYFKGNLSAAGIEALDELFPASKAMTGGAVRWSSAMVP